MGISSSYLTRLMKKAKDDGFVRIYVDTDRETELAARLLEKYPHLVHVEVVPSGPTPEHTAQALGTVAADWLDDLLDEDEASASPSIENIAIGGSMVHESMVDQLARRKRTLNVGPTALTPQMGKTDRFTAVSLATALAMRWSVIGPGARTRANDRDVGWLYTATVEPPDNSLSSLEDWFDRLQINPDYLDILRFWNQIDIAFVSTVTPDWRYSDVHRRLQHLGLSTDELMNRGATALFANRFLDQHCIDIPLSDGILSYEPVIPTEVLRSAVSQSLEQNNPIRFVVLDAFGTPGTASRYAVSSGLANVLFCDTICASTIYSSRNTEPT